MKTSTPEFIKFLKKHCDPFVSGYKIQSNVKIHVEVMGKYESIVKVFIMTDYYCNQHCMFELETPNSVGKFFTFDYDKSITFRFTRL